MDKLQLISDELVERLKNLKQKFENGGSINSMESFKHHAQIYYNMGCEVTEYEYKQMKQALEEIEKLAKGPAEWNTTINKIYQTTLEALEVKENERKPKRHTSRRATSTKTPKSHSIQSIAPRL